ncbi:glycosyltransferase [candidate division KSB1 bacterium]|nr:glycosyltransferase [candidate division KSB1 bacterium]
MSFTTSVIITAYNRPHLLERALISLAHQSVLPDELIVSDDGSQEDILSVLKAFKSQFDRSFIYTRQEDRGFRLARCRNNGIRASRGDYIIFLDQDLIYTKYFIETLMQQRRIGRFCTSYPVRLSEEQTGNIDIDMITNCQFDSIITSKQHRKIKKQFLKDRLYYYLKLTGLRAQGAKLRGGACGINRADIVRVNGYDENYIGWGNEDDDLAHRLYRSGIIGINVSYNEFPIHLYHEPFHDDGKRVNRQYYHRQKRNIGAQKQFTAKIGLDNPADAEEISIELIS